MTDIKAKVVEFELHPHPEADTLSIAIIKGTGWQCIVRTSDVIGKSLGVYIPIDAEVSVDVPQFSFLASQAKSGGKFRIKTIRLRNRLSQGLLIPAPENAKLGDDLTETLRVTRWEPPITSALVGGDQVREPGNFQKYTSIENQKNFPNVFDSNDMVRVTEKLHGTNCRFGFVNDGLEAGLSYIVGTHKTARNKDGNNIYSRISRELKIEENLAVLVQKENPKIHFIVFGEIFGYGVQDLHYGCEKNKQSFRIFDVLVDHRYQTWEKVCEVATALGVATVPLLYRGGFDPSLLIQLRDGATTLGHGHVREGVVVTAEPETTHPEIGRKIIKYISDDYLLRKGATDGH